MKGSVAMSESGAYSPFAISLHRLLDETGMFTRAEWSTFLDVPEGSIASWCIDQDVPSPDMLSRIYWVLTEGRDSCDAVIAFERMANRRIEQMSPFGGQLRQQYSPLPCLDFGQYMRIPKIQAFLRALAIVPYKCLESVLLECAQHCHAFVSTDSYPIPLHDESMDHLD